MKFFGLVAALSACSASAVSIGSEQIPLAEEFTPTQYTVKGVYSYAESTDELTYFVDHEANTLRIDYAEVNLVQFFDGSALFAFKKSSGRITCETVKLTGDPEIPHFKKNIGEFKKVDFVYGKLVDVYRKKTSGGSFDVTLTTYLDSSTGYFMGEKAYTGTDVMTLRVTSFVPAVDVNEFKIPDHIECTETSLNEVENSDVIKMILKL